MPAPPYNRTLGRLRLTCVFLVVAILLAFARPTPGGVGLGFPFVAAGAALRLWAAGHLIKTRVLITSGPYGYTRNPLYLGRLLILTGLCIMARLPLGANWIVLAAGYAIFFAYYLPRKERVEPARLREAHGPAYESYHDAVPALFPAARPYAGRSTARWTLARTLANREHWMVAGLLGTTLFLLARSQSGV